MIWVAEVPEPGHRCSCGRDPRGPGRAPKTEPFWDPGERERGRVALPCGEAESQWEQRAGDHGSRCRFPSPRSPCGQTWLSCAVSRSLSALPRRDPKQRPRSSCASSQPRHLQPPKPQRDPSRLFRGCRRSLARSCTACWCQARVRTCKCPFCHIQASSLERQAGEPCGAWWQDLGLPLNTKQGAKGVTETSVHVIVVAHPCLCVTKFWPRAAGAEAERLSGRRAEGS